MIKYVSNDYIKKTKNTFVFLGLILLCSTNHSFWKAEKTLKAISANYD